MHAPAAEPRGFVIDCEPVCDRCGHGEGLHADSTDVECIACVERNDGQDCPSFISAGAAWGGHQAESPVRGVERMLAWRSAAPSEVGRVDDPQASGATRTAVAP